MERTDDTGFAGIKVIQTEKAGYGVDAVLLAAFAAGETGAGGMAAGSRAADLGTALAWWRSFCITSWAERG